MDEGPLTISAAAPLIARGELTPSELLEQCLARIDRYEPRVKAWVYLDRDRARQEADELTRELKAGRCRGPLHGIPIGIKDIIDVFDMPTGCGSKLWANSYARKDATCVKRLRQAGALILGKTVTTPFAYLDPSVTRNPWNHERTPGGSSSGSAAAVACGMCLAALGSQTGGSTIRPASFCGVCGLKPTHGWVDVEGVLPLAPSLDHIGVIARGVRDLSAILNSMRPPTITDGLEDHSASFGLDKATRDRSSRLATIPNYLSECVEPVMQRAFSDFRRRTEEVGWKWTSFEPPVAFTDLLRQNTTIYAGEASSYHSDRIARHPDDYPAMIRRLIDEGRTIEPPAHAEAVQHQESLRDEVQALLTNSRQILVFPAASGPAPDRSTTGSPALQTPWSYTGLPVVSLPIGRSPDSLPLAIQLVGNHWCDDTLLQVAALVEADLGLDCSLPPS